MLSRPSPALTLPHSPPLLAHPLHTTRHGRRIRPGATQRSRSLPLSNLPAPVQRNPPQPVRRISATSRRPSIVTLHLKAKRRRTLTVTPSTERKHTRSTRQGSVRARLRCLSCASLPSSTRARAAHTAALSAAHHGRSGHRRSVRRVWWWQPRQPTTARLT